MKNSLRHSEKWVTKINNSTKFPSIMAIALILFTIILTPSVNGLSLNDERGRKLFGGYRITPKFCRPSKTLPKSDPRSDGPTICMFNHECAQRNGEVVGACMDGFLFGACCQVPATGETILIQSTKQPPLTSNLAAAYETYGSQQPPNSEQNGNQQGSNSYENDGELEIDSTVNNFNSNTNSVQETKKPAQFYVEKESVLVSSPSTNQISPDSYRPLPPAITPTDPNIVQIASHTYSTELPMKITTQNYGSSESVLIHQTTLRPQKLDPNDILSNGEFTHSDITHPGADTILIEDDLQFSTGYGPSTVYVPAPAPVTTEKIQYQKPIFKPKPKPSTTKPNDKNKYVLVQTITKGATTNQPSKNPVTEDGMTTHNIESIESIILMLNDSNHGPSYNSENASTDATKLTFSSSFGSQRPPLSTVPISVDKYGPNSYYITTKIPEPGTSTHTPVASPRPTIITGSGHLISTPTPSANSHPLKHSTKYPTTRRPVVSTSTPTNPQMSADISGSTIRPPMIITSSGTKRPIVTAYKKPPPSQPSLGHNEIHITPTRKPATRRPIKNPPSTSYVTGPTPPRLPSTYTYAGSSTLPTLTNKISIDVNGFGNDSPQNLFTLPEFISSTQKINIVENAAESESNDVYQPIYVQIPQVSNTLRPHPTVIITPKPTVSNVGTSPTSWTQRPNNIIKNNPTTTTTANPKQPSTSYVFSPIVTRRPESSSTQEYVSMAPISSNDFDDPGYYGVQTTTGSHPEFNQGTNPNLYTNSASDDRPSFPGYYGPTPAYSTFNVPTVGAEKIEEEEETYTSPNDFVNFPPVRNPNLNMSATSSSVTNDYDISTPTFVEDDILKDKMNLLVSKIVASLQGNFEALADLVEDDNITRTELSSTVRPVATRRPTSSLQTKLTTRIGTTRRPATKQTVKPSPTRSTTIRPAGTKRPTASPQTTKKPNAQRKPTVTRRPSGTQQSTKKPTKPIKTTKPNRKSPTTVATTTTTIAPEDEVIEENDEENEIEEDADEEATRKFRCGVRPHVKSGRIVGGKGATFGEWPWQVLVRESTWLGLFTKNKCGGVLITNKFIMTAAHCQPGFLASLVAVFGEFDISGDLETKRSVTKNVKRVIVHRQYDAATFENDLALLELESAIIYDTHIVPICMPSDIADFTGRMATVTGWGRLKYGGGVPSVLQEVQVPIIENSVCQEMFHTAGHNKKILQSFLCAGYANGQKDSCEGDSGGPLVLQRSDGRWELAGTVSHGIKCAAPYLPGVYMRTTFYKPWLKTVTGIK